MNRKVNTFVVNGTIHVLVVNPNEMVHPPPTAAVVQQVPVQSPPPPPRPLIIGHCIFCLRQLTEAVNSSILKKRTASSKVNQNEMRIVPKADLQPTLVSTFNKLLPCLHKKWRMRGDDTSCPELAMSSKSSSGGGGESSSLPKKFPHLPAMCEFCGNKFLELDKIFKLLNTRIQELSDVIRSSKEKGTYSWRWEQFKKDLMNNQSITEKSLKATFEFYEGLGLDDAEAPVEQNAHEQMETSIKIEPLGNDDQVTVKTEVDDNNFSESHCTEMEDMMMHSPDLTQEPVENSPKTLSSSKLTSEVNVRKAVPSVQGGIKKKVRGPGKKGRKPRIYTVTGKAKCDFCALIVLRTEIKSHLQEHIKDYVCSCPNPGCHRAFSTPFRVEHHLRINGKCRKVVKPSCKCGKTRCTCEYEKKCEVCGFKTKNPFVLTNHIERLHEIPSEKNFFCPIDGCKKGFTVRHLVYRHLNRCHNLNMMTKTKANLRQKCVKCGNLVDVESMGSHLQTDHQASQVITCKECQFVFPSWETLLEHLSKHRKNPKCLTCYICNDGVKFANRKLLEYHFYIKHNVGKLFSCDHCKKSFFNKIGLITHVRFAHNGSQAGSSLKSRNPGIAVTKPKMYYCDVDDCGLGFLSGKSLRTHKIRNHLGPGLFHKFVCPVEGCERKFSSWSHLEQHKMVKHFGVKAEKVICEDCGESFSSSKCLSTHQLIHTGERPLQCSYCGQRFRHLSALGRHVQSHEKKGDSFKPNGPMKHIRKRVRRNQ